VELNRDSAYVVRTSGSDESMIEWITSEIPESLIQVIQFHFYGIVDLEIILVMSGSICLLMVRVHNFISLP
jgi:hypothetical protein